ncbi:hypothetical protein [Aquipuribacter sp. MA13-6]|uniref:hypothetical protein n=1 Tax=unclassified Aquipuribacter TaxID=2635084 RepID=UPI003EE9E8C4
MSASPPRRPGPPARAGRAAEPAVPAEPALLTDLEGHVGPEGPVDPAEQLRLVAEQQARTHRALAPDERVLLGAWGTAWLVGFGVMWLASPLREGGALVPLPGLFVGLLFFVLLLGAAIVTGVYSVRAYRGVAGPSARTGAMYGWGWFLGFGLVTCVALTAERLGAPPDVTALLWPALSGLVVGLMYVAGAAVWDDPLQFAIGAWILVTTGVGCLLGLLPLYLVMGLAGGGGFLAAAAWFTLRPAGRASSVART